MSGVCPNGPARDRVTYDDTIPSIDEKTTESPDGDTAVCIYNECGGGTYNDTVIGNAGPGTSETVTLVTNNPGPPGPQGPCCLNDGLKWAGEWSSGETYNVAADDEDKLTDIVRSSNNNTYICIQSHTADASTEPGVGASWTSYWDVIALSGNGNMTWRGMWAEGISYSQYDHVTHNRRSYQCLTDHTSTFQDEPDRDFDYEGGLYWILVSDAMEEEEKGFFEELGESAWDWLKDYKNWGWEDYVGAVAIGAGVIWAAGEVDEMFEYDPYEEPSEGSNYTGDPTYSTVAFQSPTLISALEQLCEYAGVTDYDTSQLDPTIRVNFTVGNATGISTLIETLALAYGFSTVDSGGTLKFVPVFNASTAVEISSEIDMGYTTSGSLKAPFAVKRLQGTSVPSAVELTYFSEANAHNEFVQVVPPDSSFDMGQRVTLQVPATLDDQEAYEIAERVFVNSHLERTTYQFNTSYKYIYLEPGDYVEVAEIGELRVIRIDEQTPGILTFTCTDVGPDRSLLNQSSSINAARPPTYTEVTPFLGLSAAVAVELPPLTSSDEFQPRIHLGPHGYGADGWQGCTVYYSDDGGSSYKILQQATSEATWGRVQAVLPDPGTDESVWDEVNTITVELKTGTLSRRPEADVLNGHNWCIVGEELIGFKTATLQSGTTYVLSGLLRGHRGTEFHMTNHSNTELFVLIDDALITFPYDKEDKDFQWLFKYVTLGTSIADAADATAYPIQPNHKSRKPWKPANLNATNDGANWNISWTARNQFIGEVCNYPDVLKPTGFAGFIMEILDVNTSVVKRAVTQQADSFVYTEAMQVQDFGSSQGTIKVRISQLDLDFGVGYNDIETFTV